MLAFMIDAYDEDELGGERRTVLRLHPALAPVKVAVLPLLRKDGHPELARTVYEELRGHMKAEYDEGGAIGRRYRRQDEIGTPFAVTIDHQSVEDRTVTLRDRDTLEQERVPIEGLAQLLQDRLAYPLKRAVVLLTWRPQPPTSSPMTTSTSAGSGATGGRRRSTSARTSGSGRRGSRSSSAARRCGTTRSSSGARTRSRPTCRRSSTPPRAPSRSTSSPPSRPTRRATPSSSSASCARSPGSATGRWPAGWRRSGRS